jgi:hypothetical protein
MPKTSVTKLKAKLRNYGSGWHFLDIPAEVGKQFETDPRTRRVVCTLNGSHTFQCALMPNKGEFVISINKSIREKLGIVDGDTVDVELVADTSKYGLPMPEEFAEVLRQDKDGNKLFHALTAGKQRSLIYMVSTVKDIDRRIHTALIVIEHLKDNDGKVIGDKLYKEIKRPVAEF